MRASSFSSRPAPKFDLNPLLAREVQARWRDRRSFNLIFLLVAGLSLLFVWLLREQSLTRVAGLSPTSVSALAGRRLFEALTWFQTVGWLLIAPALTSSSIAYERERGWFDALLLSRLLPRQIALGKWVSALLYAGILGVVTLPFWVLSLFLGGVSPGEFRVALLMQILCASSAAAIGLGASSWSLRAHVALRSANGIILTGLAVSAMAGAMVGEGPLAGQLPASIIGAPRSSPFLSLVGHTNPIAAVQELIVGAPQQHWAVSAIFLTLVTAIFLSIGAFYSRQPLEEAPFIEARPKKKTGEVTSQIEGEKTNETPQTHAQIPLVSRLKFANPVLDREVRSKFRMRQPPLMVIVVEVILAFLVGFFYLRTLYSAIFDPTSRVFVWWGVIFTTLILIMMAAAVMGGNGLSRERESGTWEGIHLSMLAPRQISGGKAVAALLSCVFFSFPIYPLLLPCIAWNGRPPIPTNPAATVWPLQALACLLVVSATAWSFTCIGLFVGRAQNRSSRAAGQSMGILASGLLVSFGLLWLIGTQTAAYAMSFVNPFVALFLALSRGSVSAIFRTGLPYFAFHLVLGWVFLALLNQFLRRELQVRS